MTYFQLVHISFLRKGTFTKVVAHYYDSKGLIRNVVTHKIMPIEIENDFINEIRINTRMSTSLTLN
jgi:hypothetical protein